ncbi:MAG: bifunctional riboflavin kinase/FAD synthetase [Gammaproteobacteria bacterium]|nr:bifunctional riboflavin kinase/FAD synthetase [Gammaproteobacteria bacterium]
MRRPAGGRGDLPASVATIGTFDGVHVGHRRIIERVLSVAAERGLPSVVLSFEPTPREYFTRGTPPARLTRFREKFERFEQLGLDWFFCPPFDADMANLEPAEFIGRLLIDTLNVRHLVVGDDFVFARNRAGTVKHLHAAGAEQGFSVEQVHSVVEQGVRVSSTEIRRALADGDMGRAGLLLGEPYSITGRVVDGRKLGKVLGFPTANVNLHRRECPIAGIFAVRVRGVGEERLDGVASIGTRPTVEGVEPILEVHIFDFDRDIYGEYISVEFVGKLRDEEKFPSLESLTEQMHIDANNAREVLSLSN